MFIKCPICRSNLDYKEEKPVEKGLISYHECDCGVTAEVFYPTDKEEKIWIKYLLTEITSHLK